MRLVPDGAPLRDQDGFQPFALYRVAGKQLQQLHNHQIGIVLDKIDRRRIDRATLVIRRMHFHR